jgi:hypothetical protein
LQKAIISKKYEGLKCILFSLFTLMKRYNYDEGYPCNFKNLSWVYLQIKVLTDFKIISKPLI